jgi:hypothetical protein
MGRVFFAALASLMLKTKAELIICAPAKSPFILRFAPVMHLQFVEDLFHVEMNGFR